MKKSIIDYIFFFFVNFQIIEIFIIFFLHESNLLYK
jgi:hypothetical protein